MKSITVLIPHNTLPYVHDSFTIQCKKICESLSKKFNLKIVWVMFPSIPANEKSVFKYTNQEIIFSDQFDSLHEIFKYVQPDFLIVNGSLDFHNVNAILMSKFTKIPVMTLFFRYSNTVQISLNSTLQNKFRSLFSKKKSASSTQSPLLFYLSQMNSIFKTLKEIHFTKFKSIVFILNYLKIIFFTTNPVDKIISGNINLCGGEKMKQQLINSKYNDSSVFMVGDPYFDDFNFIVQDNQSKKQFDKLRILFCPTPRHEHGECSKKKEFDLIIKIINLILNEDNFEIGLKIHPSSSIMKEYVDELKDKIFKPIVFYQSEKLSELLKKYDMMITYGGTGATNDAILLRKPIVNLDFGFDLTGPVYYDDKIITQCKNIFSLISDIKYTQKRIISQSDVERFFHNYYGFSDGKSSERAADVIYKFLQNVKLIEK